MDGRIVTGSLLDLGPYALSPGTKLKVFAFAGGRAGLRAQVRVHCPRKPGIYAMIDRQGDIIYVGKAKSLRVRLQSYFRARGRNRKAGCILARTRTLLWEVHSSEFAALHRELELIQRWRPRFNVVGLPRWRNYVWVCLGRQPAPYVFLARRPRGSLMGCFGPVPAGERASEAVRRLNNLFGLRDCPQSQELRFSEQGELFPMVDTPGCLRYEIGACLGPCIAACSRAEYDLRVRAVQSFLLGSSLGLLEELQRDMNAAAAEHRYEKAGAFRDKLLSLQWLHGKLEQMRRVRAEGSFIYPVGELWYLIHAGRAIACIPAPRDEPGRQAARELIDAVYAKDNVGDGLTDYDKFEGVLLLNAWFRKYPQERPVPGSSAKFGMGPTGNDQFECGGVVDLPGQSPANVMK